MPLVDSFMEDERVHRQNLADAVNGLQVLGTFTPTLISFDGTNPSVTYVTQSGRYTKVGNHVIGEFDLAISAHSLGTGRPAIGGLPFTAHPQQVNGGFSLPTVSNLNLTAGYSQFSLAVNLNTTNALLVQLGDNVGAANFAFTDVAANFAMVGQVIYEV
mgnify:CR=1 FL=1